MQKPTTETQQAALRDAIMGGLLPPALLVLGGILGLLGPSFWLAGAFGLIVGMIWSKRQFTAWSDYQHRYSNLEVKQRGLSGIITSFLILLAFLVVMSLIEYVLGEAVSKGIPGLGIGIGGGFFEWPLWLYLHRDKSQQTM